MSRGTGKIAFVLFLLSLAWSSWDPTTAVGDPAGGTPTPKRRTTWAQRIPTPMPIDSLRGPATAFEFPLPSPLAPVPIPGSSFPGLLDDLHVIPPDTMGAVGPAHLVSFLNSEVGIFNRTGTLLNPGTTLRDFWLPLINSNNLPDNQLRTTVFDPKVLYDQHSGRFVAMTLIGQPPDKSWVLLARSNTSDPTQGWNRWALAASSDNTLWADYPGLGVDAGNIYITTNLFDNTRPNPNFHHITVWVVPKTTLPPSGQDLANATELSNPFQFPALNIGPFSFQPAHVFGTPGVSYIVGEDHVAAGSALRIGRIWPLPFADLGTVPITFYSSQLPLAPFLQIDTGDSRIQNVVSRNGRIFATHTIPHQGPALATTAVRWYEIDINSMLAVQQGTISDPNRFYYYPSIAVNSTGDIAIGFSGSSSSPPEYAGAYYTARRAADTSGTMHPVTLLKSGQASYSKTINSGVRWGDFSATVVDPLDDRSFWTLQEIASTPVVTQAHGVADSWATWWGSFGPPAIDPPTDLTVAQLSPTQFRLTWTNTVLGTDNIVVERRTAPAGDFAPIDILPTTATTYTDTFAASSGTTYFYRVRVRIAAGSSYSNEAFATHSGPVPPPPAPSGGGGGGCLTILRSGGEQPFATSLISIGILLLPATVLGLLRFSRRFARKCSFRHPAC